MITLKKKTILSEASVQLSVIASLNSKEFCVKSILIFKKIVHTTSDNVFNFQVDKPKINFFILCNIDN